MVEQTIPQADLNPVRAAVLHRIAQSLARTADTNLFLREALGELSELLQLTFAIVTQRERNEIVQLASASGFIDPPTRLALDATPEIQAALISDHTTLIAEPDASPLVAQLRPLLPCACAALLFVPLLVQGKPRGALLLGASAGQRFAPEDVALVELVASSLTTAVYVKRLTDAMRQRNEHLAMLADIAAHVSSSLEPREVYRRVVSKLNEYFRVNAGSLLLKDEATDELIFTITLEGGEERLSGLRLPPGLGIVGYVGQSQQVHISNDVQNDPLFYPWIGEQIGLRCENILCVPMIVKGSTVGVIEMINKLEGEFNSTDAQRLADAAHIIGVAIENARLFEFVRRRRDRLELLIARAKAGLPDDRLVTFLTNELETEDNLLGTMFNNPYIVGAPVREPEMCFGRAKLLNELLSVLHQNSLLLHGERRIGKTTILRQLELLLHRLVDERYCYKPIYIDLEGIKESALFRHIIEEIMDGFGTSASALQLRYSRKRRPYSGSEFQHDMRTLIAALCGPQPDGRINRLVLLIDEADVMYSYNEQILQEFRRVFMKDYAVYLSVVFAAINIQRQWKRYESPFYNLFQEIQIPPLARDATELLARMPVRGHFDYDDAAIDLIYQLSQGRPMRIQRLCLEAINYIREHERTHVMVEDIVRVGELLKGTESWS
jgi:GAF domain-containing protein